MLYTRLGWELVLVEVGGGGASGGLNDGKGGKSQVAFQKGYIRYSGSWILFFHRQVSSNLTETINVLLAHAPHRFCNPSIAELVHATRHPSLLCISTRRRCHSKAGAISISSLPSLCKGLVNRGCFDCSFLFWTTVNHSNHKKGQVSAILKFDV